MPAVQPLVSVIVPAHLTSDVQRELLGETLTSVLSQTYSRYEAIVVDDGSTVDIADVVHAHGAALIRQNREGSAVARNSGILAGHGEYVVFLDADDHLLPSALEAGVRHLVAHPDCAFAVGPHEEMAFGQTWPTVVPPPGVGRIYLPLLAVDWQIIPPSSAIFRRDAVDSIGGFRDPWGADDLDFYLRLAYLYDACCYAAPPVTRYRPYRASSWTDCERVLRSMRVVYERQRPLVHGDPAAEAAFARGHERLTRVLMDCLVENVAERVHARQWGRALRSASLLAIEDPRRFFSALAGGSLTHPPASL